MTTRLSFIFLCFSIIIFWGCSKDDDPDQNPIDNGFSDPINALISPAQFKILDDLGMPVYPGDAPPVLDTVFRMSPFVFKATNDAEALGNVGDTTRSRRYRFKPATNGLNDLALDIGIELPGGFGGVIVVTQENNFGFLSGDGDGFSLFIPQEYEDTQDNETMLLAMIVSGRVTANGLTELHRAEVVVNTDYDGNGSHIVGSKNRNTYIYHDLDGLSPIIPSFY